MKQVTNKVKQCQTSSSSSSSQSPCSDSRMIFQSLRKKNYVMQKIQGEDFASCALTEQETEGKSTFLPRQNLYCCIGITDKPIAQQFVTYITVLNSIIEMYDLNKLCWHWNTNIDKYLNTSVGILPLVYWAIEGIIERQTERERENGGAFPAIAARHALGQTRSLSVSGLVGELIPLWALGYQRIPAFLPVWSVTSLFRAASHFIMMFSLHTRQYQMPCHEQYWFCLYVTMIM